MKPLDIVRMPLEPGISLVEASAGTGKTYSIAALYLRLVLEEQRPVSEILCVTYTVAATQELKDRIRQRLHRAWLELRGEPIASEAGDPVVAHFREQASEEALRHGLRALALATQSFDEAAIHTIHSFCQRTLQEHAFESGTRYGAELLDAADALQAEVFADFWRCTFYRTGPLQAALGQALKLTPETWRDLVALKQRNPFLQIRPEAAPPPRAELESALEAHYRALLQAWPEAREAVSTILLGDKGLRRRAGVLHLQRIPEILQALETLREERPLPSTLLEIALLAPDSLQRETKPKGDTPTHPFFDRCGAFWECAQAWKARLERDFLDHTLRELRLRKHQRHAVSFDDLLTRLHEALQGPQAERLIAALRRRYTVALVDEFQDTDPLQADIFTRLFASTRLFLIGDPKQAIYGFRGADIFTYLAIAGRANQRYFLETNWRSGPTLLDAFNHFFTRIEQPFLFEAIRYQPVKAPAGAPAGDPQPFRIRYLKAEPPLAKQAALRQVAEAVASEIAGLIQRKEARPGAVAILIRRHQEAAVMQAALRRRAIPSVLQTQQSVFDTEEAEQLADLLEAIAQPREEATMRRALSTGLFALDAAAIAALDEAEAERDGWMEQFLQWHERWLQHGFAAMFRALMVGQQLRERLLKLPDGERQLTNFLHLAELLHDEETRRRLMPEAVIHWLRTQRGESRSDATELRLESDAEAVTIMTIHRSKGLEFPIVFCPTLWYAGSDRAKRYESFHNAEGQLIVDLSPEETAEQTEAKRRESRAEAMRLLYVAVTRAKHRLYLFAGDFLEAHASSLGHLLGVDAEGGLGAALQGLAAARPEAFEYREEVAPPEALSATAEGVAPVPRPFRGSIRRTPLLASFTGLVSRRQGELEVAEPPEEDEPPAEEVAPVEEEEAAIAPIFRLEKGIRIGDFLHDVLEGADFANPATVPPLMEAARTRYGIPASLELDAVEPKLREVFETELIPGLALNRLAPRSRRSEVEFLSRLPSLRPADLLALYQAHPSASVDPAAIARLQFPPVEGYLRGVIDLLFTYEGRTYLLDWKSNWLGNRPEDYNPPALEAAMRHHYYGVQAHLYLMATDAYLANRLPGYDYERDFGGILYLFVRGVGPGTEGGPARGVYFEKPPLAFVEALRTVLSVP